MVNKELTKQILEYGDKITKLERIKQATVNMTVGSSKGNDRRCDLVAAMISDVKNILTDEILEAYNTYNNPVEKEKESKTPTAPKSTVAGRLATK